MLRTVVSWIPWEYQTFAAAESWLWSECPCCITAVLLIPEDEEEQDKNVELHVLGYTEHTAEEVTIHSFQYNIKFDGPVKASSQGLKSHCFHFISHSECLNAALSKLPESNDVLHRAVGYQRLALNVWSDS